MWIHKRIFHKIDQDNNFVLLFNTLITNTVSFVAEKLETNKKPQYFTAYFTCMNEIVYCILQEDICCVWMTNIECIMTILDI